MTTICHNGEGPTITSAFDNIILENSENNNRKYSIGKDSNGNTVVIMEKDIFKERKGEKRKKWCRSILKNT